MLGRLDLVRVQRGRIGAAVSIGAPRTELEAAPPHLVEHGIGELLLDRYRLLLVVLGVVELNRLLDRVTRGLPRQVLEMQIVAVDVADPTAEELTEPAVAVFAHGDQEVRRHAGRVDAFRQLVSQPIGMTIAQAIAEVLLELIEDDHEGRVELVSGGGDRGGERTP